MIDEVFAGEVLFGHRSIDGLEEPEMRVHVHHGGHDGLARHIDMSGTVGNLNLSSPSDRDEPIALDDDRRVVDRWSPLAGDAPSAFEDACSRCGGGSSAGGLS